MRNSTSVGVEKAEVSRKTDFQIVAEKQNLPLPNMDRQ